LDQGPTPKRCSGLCPRTGWRCVGLGRYPEVSSSCAPNQDQIPQSQSNRRPLHRPRCSVLRELSETIEVRLRSQLPTAPKSKKQPDDPKTQVAELWSSWMPMETIRSRLRPVRAVMQWLGFVRPAPIPQETFRPHSNAWTALRLAIYPLASSQRAPARSCTTSTLLEYSKESQDANF
jgi:hypothetical protein